MVRFELVYDNFFKNTCQFFRNLDFVGLDPLGYYNTIIDIEMLLLALLGEVALDASSSQNKEIIPVLTIIIFITYPVRRD